MKYFNELSMDSKIQQALTDLGYETLTTVQEAVVERMIANNKDYIVQSKTGSGKTLAFSLPLVEKVDWEENRPQALILAPTRELAEQIKEEVQNVGRYKRVNAVAVYGKQPFKYQQLQLKQKTHIVVGTPGRILDHLQKGTLMTDKLKYVVVDEADEMFNRGFIEQLEAILELLPKNKSMSLFSATMPKEVQSLVEVYMNTPEVIEVENKALPKQITHEKIQVDHHDKYDTLLDILTVENPVSSIIFCATKERVNELCGDLYDEGLNVDKLQGDMNQEDRLAVISDFKRGLFRYLIATDVAARGIDVDSIPLIVNYDIPYEKNAYVHRTGRTGRMDRTGKALTFYTPNQTHMVETIEEVIEQTMQEYIAPSPTEVDEKKDAFYVAHKEKLEKKVLKRDLVNEQVMKLYFNGGKKKKLRAVDFVGTICQIDGVNADDIGIITVMDTCSYVDILNDKGERVLSALKKKTIKGKQLKVHPAKK